MAQINFLSTSSCGFFPPCAHFSSNNSEFQWFFGVFIDIIEDNIGIEFFNTTN